MYNGVRGLLSVVGIIRLLCALVGFWVVSHYGFCCLVVLVGFLCLVCGVLVVIVLFCVCSVFMVFGVG